MEKQDPLNEENDDSGGCICQRWPMLILALSFFIFGAVGLIVSYAMLHNKSLEHKKHYGVVMDAGSTHTDITVYRWPSDVKFKGTAHVNQIGYSTCSNFGISKFYNSPSNVSQIIERCVEDVALQKVPKHNWHHTPIYVGATAGMRLLCARNMTACDQIMTSVRKSLTKYKFQTFEDSVKVLTGKQEGTFGWVTVNILKKRIAVKGRSHDRPTFGALDMGGASAEISFIPATGTLLPDEYKSELRLYGKNYTLYTHSFLCYGMKEAERRLLASLVQESGYAANVSNPCYPSGFQTSETAKELWLRPCSIRPKSSIFPIEDDSAYTFQGTSRPEECIKHVRKLFNETTCNYGSCSFDGAYQPGPTGNFVAFSGYGFVADFLNLTEDDSLQAFAQCGREFCQKSWEQMKEENPEAPQKFLPRNCFNAVYMNQILTRGFHFEENSTSVHFRSKVKGHDVGWSLGFMVNASNLVPVEKATSKITRQDFLFFSSLSVVVVAFSFMLCFCYFVKKCRRRTDQYALLP